MKRLILLAGLPGVGKSAISAALRQATNGMIVDIDDFKRANVDPNLVKSQIDPPEQRWTYYQQAALHVLDLFRRGAETIIVDEVFHLASLRADLENLCRLEGVDVLWAEVRCPYTTVESRLRAKDREGHILSTDEALRMYLLFGEIFEAFPADASNHLVVNNEDGLTASVAGILERL
ncbi:MAG: AAA family ATPase [Candidatus Uhrbacteria bacterium]